MRGGRGDQVFDKVAPLLLANSLICAALRWQLVAVAIIGLYLLLMPLQISCTALLPMTLSLPSIQLACEIFSLKRD